MSGLVAGLFGAPGAASTAGGYYQNAANQFYNTAGSPAANMFSKEYIASLQPGFQQQDQALAGNLAAQGITNSGAAKADYSDLSGQQSAAEAAGIAPLYSQALGQYGNILSQEPGAQVGAYNNAIEQGYQGIQGLGSLAGSIFGLGGGGGGGGGGLDYSGTNAGPSFVPGSVGGSSFNPYGP